MKKIFKYSFFDQVRSRWLLFYTGFFLLLTSSLFWLSNDLSKVMISLMNVVLLLVPLVATMMGVMYYYNSREFVELLLAQPIKRTNIFLGQYLGLSTSLALCLIVGISLPAIFFGVIGSDRMDDYLMLLLSGVFLSYIFSGLAYFISLRNENRIRGFGLALVTWLFFAVIYDGLFLLALALFSDYPLEKPAIAVTIFNPIDLSRILILLKLDISALMGYTGAVFQNFFNTGGGLIMALAMLMVWIALPVWGVFAVSAKKDF